MLSALPHMQTIVIGHKNPDMDSICSAVAYAHLKQVTGTPNVIAARAGNTNERIDFVLQKFGVEPPVFISDLSDRVGDVMERDVICVQADSTAYDAIHLLEKRRLRGLPVVDGERRFLGLLSAFKISHHLFPPREEADAARLITAPLSSIVDTFGGRVLTGELPNETAEYLLMIGAMSAETFAGRLGQHRPEKLLLFVGDREDIQMQAIEAKVRAIVVTGDLPVSPAVEAAARAGGVTLVRSAHDTAISVDLARGAVQVRRMLEPEHLTFTPETLLEEVREKAAHSAAFVYPILDEAGVLVGILAKSNLLKRAERQLILVDHNELSQAVKGADKVRIVEILDHHRIGGFATDAPILFWNNPVGSTSTIIALCYRQAGVPVPRAMAGLLMAGLLSDTLNLNSPTATETDRLVLEELSKIAGVDPAKFAEEIFSVGSPLLTLTPEQVITADCKEYEEDGVRFTVSQIEELSFSHFPEKQEALLAALEAHTRKAQLFFAALLVTDINTQTSILLCCGAPEFLQRIDFPPRGSNMWELAGVVSRKKQLLPYLLQRLAALPAA
ncbi:MAG: putative manganese-dependent inorganic diphosphatase [Verrucomicrobiota bacterium]|nr:putative manganese-dependent inorganic diphosphatase [Verrucomicrobiota bacterium]